MQPKCNQGAQWKHQEQKQQQPSVSKRERGMHTKCSKKENNVQQRRLQQCKGRRRRRRQSHAAAAAAAAHLPKLFPGNAAESVPRLCWQRGVLIIKAERKIFRSSTRSASSCPRLKKGWARYLEIDHHLLLLLDDHDQPGGGTRPRRPPSPWPPPPAESSPATRRRA